MTAKTGLKQIEEHTAPRCSRCGRCCRVMALRIARFTGTLADYLVLRGAYRDNKYWVIPSPCQHLVENGDGTTNCGIYEKRPILCRVGPIHPNTYAPRGCAFREDE